jgi:Na+:H+ antiporter
MATPEPIAAVALALALILVAAKLAGDLAVRVGQPPVLGELLCGVVLGNLSLAHVHALDWLKDDASLGLLAQLGVLLLLFQVGLESTVKQLLGVGRYAFAVGAVGVITPAVLGWGVGAWLLPHTGPYVHAFLGAALAATSVGITARVLQDLDRTGSREAHIILGASVIDDVLALVILAVCTAAADGGSGGGVRQIVASAAKALVFLVAALALGVKLSPALFRSAARLRGGQVLLATGLAFCFFGAWLASVIGLSPIVGAFAAGLVLEHAHSEHFVKRGEPALDQLIAPIVAFLVPVFFVIMGMRTDLRALVQPGVLGLAAALTAAAILGKQACSLVAGPGVDRLSVGIGMIPRGEVGLIFANLGLGLRAGGQPVVDERMFSALVFMIIVTTLVTPPALEWSLSRGRK